MLTLPPLPTAVRRSASRRLKQLLASIVLLSFAWVGTAKADPVVEWNRTACEIVAQGDVPPPAMYRIMALVQVASRDALNDVVQEVAAGPNFTPKELSEAIEAALAASNGIILQTALPAKHAAIDAACVGALEKLGPTRSRLFGEALGERAARRVLEARKADTVAAESYRPLALPGKYVPTTLPVVSTWPGRAPWFMTSPSEFRPGPPPPLESEVWARDYAEVKALGALRGSTRTAEQTAIARYWEATAPAVYFSVLRSVAELPNRQTLDNARLFAGVAQAMDEALIAVFDAKYHYGFWRPITAIRNGDIDGNELTERDGSWLPFVMTPSHPEYPCAHCALAGAVGTVIRAEVGTGPVPVLKGQSPTAPGVPRSWETIEAFVQEVSEARIYDGVHYRNSTEVGTALGVAVGEFVAKKAR